MSLSGSASASATSTLPAAAVAVVRRPPSPSRVDSGPKVVQMPTAYSSDEPSFLRDLRLTLDLASLLDAGQPLEIAIPVVEVTAPLPEHSPQRSREVALPQEVVDAIVSWVDADNLPELRRLALVNRVWASAARRPLYASIQALVSTGALMRLRAVLEASPQLTRHVRKVDLSNPNCRWEPQQVSEFFRRASGLLRDTPLVSDISILHISLSDAVRRKLWGAIAALPIKNASFDSSCWSSNNGHRTFALNAPTPDIDALVHTLTRWTGLRNLSLHAYNLHPRQLLPLSAPSHAYPAYQLVSLEVASCDLGGATLLWLLGRSAKSLKQLNLTNLTGITLDELEDCLLVVGPSLDELQITLDQDDFVPTSPPRAINAKAFASLTALKTLVIATDMDTKALLDQLARLPALSFLAFNCPSLPFARVQRFLEMSPPTLKDLNLDLWGEDESWNCYSRYLTARECGKRGIDLLIDGCDTEELEDAWFGVGGGMDSDGAGRRLSRRGGRSASR